MNSIILPTYCPAQEVESALHEFMDTLAMSTTLPAELVVVEQGKRLVEKDLLLYKSTGAIVHSQYRYYPDPIGYARAVNIGASLAVGDYLFIVNNDLKLPYGWDAKLLTAYRSVPDMGLLSPLEHTRGGYNGIILNESWWSCVLISRKVWETVGPLDDEKLNYRFHDQDWSIRCKRKGFQVARLGSLRVHHIDSTTYKHMPVKREEGEERAEMIRRYGYAHFFEWFGHGAK